MFLSATCFKLYHDIQRIVSKNIIWQPKIKRMFIKVAIHAAVRSNNTHFNIFSSLYQAQSRKKQIVCMDHKEELI